MGAWGQALQSRPGIREGKCRLEDDDQSTGRRKGLADGALQRTISQNVLQS